MGTGPVSSVGIAHLDAVLQSTARGRSPLLLGLSIGAVVVVGVVVSRRLLGLLVEGMVGVKVGIVLSTAAGLVRKELDGVAHTMEGVSNGKS